MESEDVVADMVLEDVDTVKVKGPKTAMLFWEVLAGLEGSEEMVVIDASNKGGAIIGRRGAA